MVSCRPPDRWYGQRSFSFKELRHGHLSSSSFGQRHAKRWRLGSFPKCVKVSTNPACAREADDCQRVGQSHCPMSDGMHSDTPVIVPSELRQMVIGHYGRMRCVSANAIGEPCRLAHDHLLDLGGSRAPRAADQVFKSST